jgi:hypothetical protein
VVEAYNVVGMVMILLRRAFIVIYILACIGAGTFCLVRPRVVREFAIKSVSQGLTGKMRFVVAFVKSDAYLWNVRFFGLVLDLMAAGLVYAFYEASRTQGSP